MPAHPPGSSGTAAHCVSTHSSPRSLSGGGGGPAAWLERRRTPVYRIVGTPSALTAAEAQAGPEGRAQVWGDEDGWLERRDAAAVAAASATAAFCCKQVVGCARADTERNLCHRHPPSPAQQPDQQPSASGPPGVGTRAGGRCRQCARSVLTAWPHTRPHCHSQPSGTCW